MSPHEQYGLMCVIILVYFVVHNNSFTFQWCLALRGIPVYNGGYFQTASVSSSCKFIEQSFVILLLDFKPNVLCALIDFFALEFF